MGWIEKEYRTGARCVFKGLCNHAPATHRYFHEFRNYPSKPLCEEHAQRITTFENRTNKGAQRGRR